MDKPIPTPEIKFVGEMESLALRPDDVLVLKCREQISLEQGDRIRDALKRALGQDRKIIILSGGLELGVLSPTET